MTPDTHRVSAVIDRARYPKLASFVEWGVNMQLADVRDLLRLPLPDAGLHTGQNFAAAGALVGFITGASVWFYDASEEGLGNRRDRRRRFTEVLESYWPWADGEVIDAQEGIRVLWDYARNPLAHTLGLPDPADGTVIEIAKSPLVEEQLVELDTADRRPEWLGPTIKPAETGAPGGAYFLAVPALYWGVQRVLRALLTDDEQTGQAEQLADTLVRYLTAPNAPWRAR
jgi:hypothetical protein